MTASSGLFTAAFTPCEDHWGFRLMRARVRKLWQPPSTEFHDQVLIPLTGHRADGDRDGIYLYWDDTAGELKLKIQPHKIWDFSDGPGDLPSGQVDYCLIRIEAWE